MFSSKFPTKSRIKHISFEYVFHFFYQLIFQKFGLICIFRFLEVYIRRAIWEYYFLSGTRVSVKMASISQSAFYIYISLQKRNPKNVFPMTVIILHLKLYFKFHEKTWNFLGHMQLNSFMNKQNLSSPSEFKLKPGVDGILVANS